MPGFEKIREMGNVIVSAGWSGATDVRRFAAAVGVIRKKTLSSKVISIGNLEAGGTGKTPLCMDLSRRLISEGHLTVLLTRGYLGQWERTGGIVSPQDLLLNPTIVGDEVALIHQRVPQLWIGVGADRTAQVELLRARVGKPIEFILLDDGFQNVKIKKDVEVVVVSSTSWGKAIFRDRLSQLKKANFICTRDPDVYQTLSQDFQNVGLFEYHLKDPGHSSYFLVTGVGNGKNVLKRFRECGYRISYHFDYPDHHSYSEALIDEIFSKAKKENAKILTTGKDGVKWRFILKGQTEKLKLLEDVEPEVKWVKGSEIWGRIQG